MLYTLSSGNILCSHTLLLLYPPDTIFLGVRGDLEITLTVLYSLSNVL